MWTRLPQEQSTASLPIGEMIKHLEAVGVGPELGGPALPPPPMLHALLHRTHNFTMKFGKKNNFPPLLLHALLHTTHNFTTKFKKKKLIPPPPLVDKFHHSASLVVDF